MAPRRRLPISGAPAMAPPKAVKGKDVPAATACPSSASGDAVVLGPFAADCANAALREEVKKLYTAIFKKVAVKEGVLAGAGEGRGGGVREEALSISQRGMQR